MVRYKLLRSVLFELFIFLHTGTSREPFSLGGVMLNLPDFACLITMHSSVLRQSSLAIYKRQGQDVKHGCLKLSTYYALSSIECLPYRSPWLCLERFSN